MVNIYLPKGNDWIHALSIPLDDIRRLSFRPLKWIRFVAFAVLGTKGHISETPGGNIVDYENISFEALTDDNNYYFLPEGDYHPVDHRALRSDALDAFTSSDLTQHRTNFHNNVGQRDGNCCVITKAQAFMCRAAHIIPHSKGDEYIRFVISDRRHLYNDQEFPPEININSTLNGIFLKVDFQMGFGLGWYVYLKTPTFGLCPADIPGLENESTGEMPSSRTTMQFIRLPGYPAIEQPDVQADWSCPDAPPNILLDYKYGAAVIKQWATDHIKVMLEERCQMAFSDIPYPPPEDDEWEDPGSQRGIWDRFKELELSKVMDMAFSFSMFFRGYSAHTTLAEMRNKQEKEAEEHAHQAGSEKVRQWLSRMEEGTMDENTILEAQADRI